jgi:chorismate-pyruvate lyase
MDRKRKSLNIPDELTRLKKMIFQLLMFSENRTTDILELITGDRLLPVVIKQHKITTPLQDQSQIDAKRSSECILRESYLRTEKNGFCVSQNIAIIYSEEVPWEVYSNILQKKEGIGHILKMLDAQSSREIMSCGWRKSSEVVDLFNNPYPHIFNQDQSLPYKQYKLTFKSYSSTGIHLLEYFNPEILSLKYSNFDNNSLLFQNNDFPPNA